MIVELTEYRPKDLSADAFPREAGRLLYEHYGEKIDVEEPTFRTNGRWRLTSKGWVGFIPLLPDLGVALRPKTPIANLFRMLEYAYDLKSFELLAGLFDAHTLEEFFERLAGVLARMVLRRGRKGFSRRYEPESERLAFIRGRVDIARAVRAPWDIRTLCHFEEHTPDTEDNRILAWTLYAIARSGLCSERVLPDVRQAYRQLASLVTLEPIPARACSGRRYDRLNDDYRAMHALCRFFLENSGPSHEAGERAMLPFLVNMARLYEKCIAEWLRKHLPPMWRLETQETLTISEEAGLSFEFDLVLYDRATGNALAVLDTKYKVPRSPDSADIQQVIAYADAKRCTRAFLVYPAPLEWPIDTKIGEVHVQTLTFAVGDDFEHGGEAFLSLLTQVLNPF